MKRPSFGPVGHMLRALMPKPAPDSHEITSIFSQCLGTQRREDEQLSYHYLQSPILFPYTATQDSDRLLSVSVYNPRSDSRSVHMIQEQRQLYSLPDAEGAGAELWLLPATDEWGSSEPWEEEKCRPPTLLGSSRNFKTETHRTSFEGDDWDFVGGRYEEDTVGAEARCEARLDDEFDCVMLNIHHSIGA